MSPDEQMSDRDLAALLASLEDEDFELDEPPAALWDRIATAVSDTDEAAGSTGPPPLTLTAVPDQADQIATTIPSPDPGHTEIGPRRSPARVSRPARRWMPTLAAAAALTAVLFVAAGIVRVTHGSSGEVAGRAELTSESLPISNDLVGRAELIELADRREIDLDLPGLPDLDDAYYELWLLAPDGSRLQSLGATTGRGRFLVPAVIDPKQFPVVDISREPPDGNPAHSGDSLVRGVLEMS
jgi:hypothetical protein